MKKLSFLFLLISFFYFGCKKNESNPVTSEPPKSLLVQNIYGQLANWIYGKSYIAEFESFGTSQIDENGKFNISNLASPADNQLININSYFDSTSTKPSISDQSAGFYIVNNITLSKAKNSGKSYGIIQCINENTAKESFNTRYIYFNKAVTIDGTATYNFSHGSWTITRKDIYNKLSFEKGWNKFVLKQGSYDRNTNTITYEILRDEPSAVSWSYTDPQTIVTISQGTAQAGLKYPLCIDNGYKRCAALYTANELHASGTIAKLAWKALTRTAVFRPIKIYLKEVDYSTLNADSLSTIMKGATQVYDSSVPLITSQWDWNEFVLMESFIYNGTKNLLVIVETNYGSSGTTDDAYFEYSVMDDNKFITWSENSLQKLGIGTLSLDRPNIKVTIDPE